LLIDITSPHFNTCIAGHSESDGAIILYFSYTGMGHISDSPIRASRRRRHESFGVSFPIHCCTSIALSPQIYQPV